MRSFLGILIAAILCLTAGCSHVSKSTYVKNCPLPDEIYNCEMRYKIYQRTYGFELLEEVKTYLPCKELYKVLDNKACIIHSTQKRSAKTYFPSH